MQPKSFYFTKSLTGAIYQVYINFIYPNGEIKSQAIIDLPKGMELKKEYSLEEKLNSFNDIFSKMVNDYKPLYAIAFYDMCTFKSLTGEVSDNYDELKKIYDEKYAWKPNQIGVTEYHYEIITITIKNTNQNEIDYKEKYNELVEILKRNVQLELSSGGVGFGATRIYTFKPIPNTREDFYKLEEILKKED
jgi:hypothetical protein